MVPTAGIQQMTISPADYGKSVNNLQSFSVMYNGNAFLLSTVLSHYISVSSTGTVTVSVTVVTP